MKWERKRMKEILLLGSHCTRSAYYRDMVQDIVDGMGLDLEVRKVVDPEEMKRYGVHMGCSNAYCPGCNAINIGRGKERYTPALVVDGQVVLHSGFPPRPQIEERLKQIAGNGIG